MHRPPNSWSDVPPLAEVVAAADYDARVGALVERIGTAGDPAALMVLLKDCVHAAGAERAAFVSLLRGPPSLSADHFMLACDPAWCRGYLEAAAIENDPWLAYAAHHSEPIVAADLIGDDVQAGPVAQQAARCGFDSALLAPAHSGPGSMRVSLLCLGTCVPGYFNDPGLGHFRLWARLLAAELHDWWQARTRQELMNEARLTPTDLSLLRHELMGHGSKRIAAELHTSVCSINSRFQRMNARLGVPSRRKAALLAAGLGLIGR